MVAVGAGDENGDATKDDFEKALRAHKDAEMKSDQREEFACGPWSTSKTNSKESIVTAGNATNAFGVISLHLYTSQITTHLTHKLTLLFVFNQIV
jgi:hypothetical protein